jgi:hypothetical protein
MNDTDHLLWREAVEAAPHPDAANKLWQAYEAARADHRAHRSKLADRLIWKVRPDHLGRSSVIECRAMHDDGRRVEYHHAIADEQVFLLPPGGYEAFIYSTTMRVQHAMIQALASRSPRA